MKDSTAKKLLVKVKNDYSAIAQDFDNTRKWLWPEFKFFKKYLKKAKNVIDIGCGNGRLYKLISKDNKVNYIGIDNNKDLINLAQKNYPRAKFLIGDFLSFHSSIQADLLFSIAAFHHIPSLKLRKKSIQFLSKNIENNGILIITVWNLFQKRYIKAVLKALFKFIIQVGKYDWNDTFIPWSKSGIKRYYHAFTPNELRKLFVNEGFEIIEMYYTRKGKKVPFLKSHNICLVCRKK